MKTRHLTLSVFLLLVLNGLANMLVQILLKKGLITTGIGQVTSANILGFVTKNAASSFIWAGIIVYSLSFFIWIVILYKADLSIIMPAGSVNYIFIPVIAMVFFHEHIGLVRCAGIVSIIAGIHFVSKSGRPRVEKGDGHG